MTNFLTTPITLVWGILAALTAVSWIAGELYRPEGTESMGAITVVIMVMAFFKVRLVLLHFMEAKTAPLFLRLMVEFYVVGVCALVLFMYF